MPEVLTISFTNLHCPSDFILIILCDPRPLECHRKIQACEMIGSSYFFLQTLKINETHSNTDIHNSFDLLPEKSLIIRTQWKDNAFSHVVLT